MLAPTFRRGAAVRADSKSNRRMFSEGWHAIASTDSFSCEFCVTIGSALCLESQNLQKVVSNKL